MKLIVDSGSTKTLWVLRNEDNNTSFRTEGINPIVMTEDVVQNIIENTLLTQEGFPEAKQIKEVYFYGAGCTPEKCVLMRGILNNIFQEANIIEVGSDMLGAAIALLGKEEGIACILGTGANSCLYDGKQILKNVPPMGYILGDEGSGASLGKALLNRLYKGNDVTLRKRFEEQYGLTYADVIERVYRTPLANRFLASLCPFISENIAVEWIDEMVTDCFRQFFRNNVSHYARPDLACNFIGSIAYHFSSQLKAAAKAEGFSVGKICREPDLAGSFTANAKA